MLKINAFGKEEIKLWLIKNLRGYSEAMHNKYLSEKCLNGYITQAELAINREGQNTIHIAEYYLKSEKSKSAFNIENYHIEAEK